jgi:hypothetical protein
VLSYLSIVEENDLLLERLILNIVSDRKNLKVPMNREILIYYGLTWILELDKDYEKLIA